MISDNDDVFEIDNPHISKSAILNEEDNSFNVDDEGFERPFTPSDAEEKTKAKPANEYCPHCNRQFFIGRLAPHLKGCTATKPFKTLKAAKKCPDYCSKVMNQSASSQQSKWKQEHEYLKQNIRFSRKLDLMQKQGADINLLKAPQNPQEQTYIFCSYCQRKFAPQIAEKHIPKCKNIFNRPPPPKNKLESKKKQPLRAIDKYSQFVGSSIYEEQEEVDNELQQPEFSRGHQSHYISNRETSSKGQMNSSQQRDLSNSQPVFLPKIQIKSFQRSIYTQRNPTLNQAYIPLIVRQKPQMQCPFCIRTFDIRAAERHIPICERVTSRSTQNSQGEGKHFFRITSKEKKQVSISPDCTESEMIKFCTNCGEKFANFHKFCGICGSKRIKN